MIRQEEACRVEVDEEYRASATYVCRTEYTKTKCWVRLPEKKKHLSGRSNLLIVPARVDTAEQMLSAHARKVYRSRSTRDPFVLHIPADYSRCASYIGQNSCIIHCSMHLSQLPVTALTLPVSRPSTTPSTRQRLATYLIGSQHGTRRVKLILRQAMWFTALGGSATLGCLG